ncbi:2OG-Fe(II) oxygenase [Candidatus Woesearchaeota archaeon]|nr:2OG-Fe(II) oxygenase [Candidatus Woesearchaeota archaeon]
MLSDWINPLYLNSVKDLQKLFASGEPFEHIVLTEFFTREKFNSVQKALAKQEFFEQESDLFSFQQTHDVTKLDDPVLTEFHQLFSSREFIQWIALLTRTRLGSTVDMSGFIYDNTDYLLPHDDRLEDRKIAYVINFSTLGEQDGGELELFTTNKGHAGTPAKRIPPQHNTLILFRVSAHSWHQVREVLTNTKRHTLGGWFHE